MFGGTRIARMACVAIVAVSLAAPALARDLRIGGGATAGAGIPSFGSTGADLGLGAGGSWSGGTDLGANTDAQATTPPVTFQSNGSASSLPPGLDRFSFQGDGKANVSVFYKVLKTRF